MERSAKRSLSGNGYLNSIQVGKPAEHPPNQLARSSWRSGIYKRKVVGPVWLGRQNLAGDGQQNQRVHGGPERAVLLYAAAHYLDWAAELGDELPAGFGPGAFGENFTVSGLDEQTVCLGDAYEVGEALIEISQPRLPCANLARRWQLPDLPRLVEEKGRGGFYARALREGEVAAGQVLFRRQRPYPEWPIRRLIEIHGIRREDADEATRAAWAWLAGCDALSELWRGQLRKKLGRGG